MMDAAVESVHRSDYDLAIVYMGTAFEVFSQNLLLDYCQKNSVTQLPSTSWATPQQAIENGNVQSDLLRYVQHLSKTDPKTSSAHGTWKTDAYNKRNAIVHRGVKGATQSEAVKACDAINAFMAYLRSLLP